MITTIILPVSRKDYIARVITSLELLECNQEEVNIIAIVDGDDALFMRVRNLVNGTKFNKRLTVKSGLGGAPPRLDVPTRRARIAAIHNQARSLIDHEHGFVFLVEDDTTFGPKTLSRLLRVANNNRAFGMGVGVEIARWGIPYVGAWTADDVYEPTVLKSVENRTDIKIDTPEERIDAGGLFCSLVKADLYKAHQFNSKNGLGPDVNLGLEMRRLGHENFLVWQIQCTHYNNVLGEEVTITPDIETKQVTLTKKTNNKWHSSY
jgi:hypothetical protein